MIPLPKKLQANNFVLTVEFEDGGIREIDVRTFLGKSPKTDEIKTSLPMFKTAFIEDGLSITWKNGFSLDPDIIYEDGMVLKNLPISASTKKSFLGRIIRCSRIANKILP